MSWCEVIACSIHHEHCNGRCQALPGAASCQIANCPSRVSLCAIKISLLQASCHESLLTVSTWSYSSNTLPLWFHTARKGVRYRNPRCSEVMVEKLYSHRSLWHCGMAQTASPPQTLQCKSTMGSGQQRLVSQEYDWPWGIWQLVQFGFSYRIKLGIRLWTRWANASKLNIQTLGLVSACTVCWYHLKSMKIFA